MKILITHELFPPDMMGGGEKLVFRLAKGLVERGHSVKVITSGDPDTESYKGIRTIRIPGNRYIMNIFSLPVILRHGMEADIIQTSSGNMCIPSYIASQILGKPVCCWVHHIFGKYWRDIRGPIIGRAFEIFERFMITRDFNAWVFQNKSSRIIGTGMGIPSRRIRMISPGIDHKSFDHKRKPKRNGKVLFVGNFSMDEATIKTKGVGYLLEAAAMLPDVKFELMGNFKDDMEKPDNVRTPGTVSIKKLANIYNRSGVFVCNSLNEGFSLALLEAMASGCPIVSTIDIGQAGIKVKPKDSKALTRGIKRYLADPKKAKMDGKKNRKLAKKYTWDNFFSGFEKLYRNLNKY